MRILWAVVSIKMFIIIIIIIIIMIIIIITQYLPKLLINGVLVLCVEMGESFRYSKDATLTSTCLTTNTCQNCPLLYKI